MCLFSAEKLKGQADGRIICEHWADIFFSSFHSSVYCYLFCLSPNQQCRGADENVVIELMLLLLTVILTYCLQVGLSGAVERMSRHVTGTSWSDVTADL